jgi:8-oxo-dGTP diphosphatase
VNSKIHVAVGVIYNSNKDEVLITKRTANQHLAGYWEFPGGKVEENEDVITALSRELFEELGITISNVEKLTVVNYEYPDKKVLLDIWKVYEWSGVPTGKENQEIAWSKINQLNQFEFPEANKHIVQTLLLSPLYVISQESYDDYSRLLSIADKCFSEGLKLFQIRLKTRNNQEISKLINELAKSAKQYDAKLILNGIPSDIHTYNIDGIHLKSKELKSYDCRPISEEYILGASCHNEDELFSASKLNVNYAFISPVLTTPSHPEKDGIGWDKFNEMRNKVRFPVYALGGMTPDDLRVAKYYGAYGVAMMGAIWSSNSKISNSDSN